MKSVAFKWRVTTTKYAYLTSARYNRYKPDYTLGGVIEGELPIGEENIIMDIVGNMSKNEYRECFNHMSRQMLNYNVNLRNWEYYYNLANEGCSNCDDVTIFYSGATATALLSYDDTVKADVNLTNGILDFNFTIPRGLQGTPGIDGAPGKDGIDGKDGVSCEYIYALSKGGDKNSLKNPNKLYGTLDKYDGKHFNQTNFVPEGWTNTPQGISEEYRYEWVSTRKREDDNNWGLFSEPSLLSRWGENGKDADNIEYIYIRTTNNKTPDNPTPTDWETNKFYQQENTYVPFITGWEGEPKGITEVYKYEWVSIRKQLNGKWGMFSTPQIWARWGEDGNGIEYIYTITNDNEVPSIEIVDGKPAHTMCGETIFWSDDYVEPTYENRFAWVATRKFSSGVWSDYSNVKLWNTYKIGGKALVDLYTRTNRVLNVSNLPSFGGNIYYYSFIKDEYYDGANNIINSFNDGGDVVWYTDIPEENSGKYLYKTSGQVILKEDIDELVEIQNNIWYGPYLIASNGEHAVSNAPYILFDDNSLSLPIKEADGKPHEMYEYSFNAKLHFGDDEVNVIETYSVNASDVNKVIIVNTTNNNGELKIDFKINNEQVFNKIEYIYVTLRGRREDMPIEATSHFKIIPHKTEDAVLYRILLNTYSVYVPLDNSEWTQEINGRIIDSRGNEITQNDANKLYYVDKNGRNVSLESGITVYYDSDSSGCTVVGKNETLPNPLTIKFVSNITNNSSGITREIEYINFINLPKDGKDGTSNRLIFLYYSTEDENEIPGTPSGGTFNFDTNKMDEMPSPSGWTETPGTGIIWLSQAYIYETLGDLIWSTPIRLTGHKGNPGDTGLSGTSPYHIELSNDMDQVFVTDNEVVITGQTIDTDITLFVGGETVKLTPSSVSVSDNSYFLSEINSIEGSDSLKLVLTLTSTTVTASTIDLYIKIELDEHGNENIDLNKKFKINVINGTLDFDLDVTPTFIKVSQDDIKSTNNVTFNVFKRDLSYSNKTVENVEFSSFNDYELEVVYYLNNDTDNCVTATTKEISVSADTINKLTILLYRKGLCLDTAVVECVREGRSYSIDLTNDYDQIYTIDNKINVEQNVSTTVYLRNGLEKVALNSSTLTINGEEIGNSGWESGTTEDSGITLTYNFDKDTEIDWDENTFDIVVTHKGKEFNKLFKLIKLNGTVDYDLHTNTSVIKKDKNNNYAPTGITVYVTKSDISTTNREKQLLTDGELPDNLYIDVYVDSKEHKTNQRDLPIVIDSSSVTNYASFELYYKETPDSEKKTIDIANVEVISDGMDGASGLTPYHVDLSNDMDQVLTINDIPISNQEFKTTISLYQGSEIQTALTSNIITCNDSSGHWNISAATTSTSGVIEYLFTPKMCELTQKEYVFDLVISGESFGLDYDLVKNFKIVKLYGTKTYDLHSSHVIVKKEKNGYSPSSITINILETDITNTGQKITALDNLDKLNNLEYKVFFDDVLKENIKYGDNIEITNDIELTSKIKVELKQNDLVIDFIDIEVVKDGIDGNEYEFIYKLYEDENEFGQEVFNTGATKDELIENSGWTVTPSGISIEKTIEVCSQRVKSAGSEEWGAWCPPFIWAKWGENGIDGDGVQYIFRVLSKNSGISKPSNPSITLKGIYDNQLKNDNQKNYFEEVINRSDFTPTKEWVAQNIKNYVENSDEYRVLNLISEMMAWTDNPSDVGPYEPYEYVSIRRKTVNSNGTCDYTYTDPTLWNEWKKDGYNSFTEFIFAVDSRDLSNCTVSGGTWKDLSEKSSGELTFIQTVSGGTGITVNWFDSVPTHNNINQYVWMVKGFANSEITYTINSDNTTGITYSDIDWSTPVKLMDSQFMQVEYSCKDIEGSIPTPINLSDIVKSNENISLSDLEQNFREKDKENDRTDWEWKNSNELSGETPVWMIISTLYNGTWTDWVVSRIKGEQGEPGENGQSISIKGTFSNIDALNSAYNYYLLTDKAGSELPNEYFLNSALTLGDCYVLDIYENIEGYLFTYIKENDGFNEAWQAIGKIRGESSYLYIAYANSYTGNTYTLTDPIEGSNAYGTTPGQYIGIHVTTQQYAGHPYPTNLYGSSTADTSYFIWSKWKGSDGFGQEQIFILSGETAPNIPISTNATNSTGGTYTSEEWNAPDFVPYGWSDVPLTPTLTETDKRCCWMVTRQYPFNGTGYNEFKGDEDDKAILFSRPSKDGLDGSSPYHIELSNDMEQVYTVNDIVQVQQTASTILTLFHGSSPINIKNIIVSDNFTTGATTSGGSIEIYRIFNTSETITDKEVTCDITVVTNSDDTLQHKFKVIKLNGNKDYDIQVNTPYIVYDAIGRDIEISITETNVDINNREIKKLSLSEYETLGLSIKGKGYKKPDAKETTLTLTDSTEDNCYKFKTSGNDFLYFDFDLMKGGVKIDTVKVEVIRNGTSPYNIDLSNDMEQVYTVNDVVQVQQTASTIFSIFNGDTKLKNNVIDFSGISAITNENNVTEQIIIYSGNVDDITDKTIFIDSGKTTDNTFTLSKVFKPGETLQSYSQDIELSIPLKNNRPTLFKTFKIVKLNGTVDYDLFVSTGVIRKDINNNYTPTGITVNVSKSDISTTNRNTEILSGNLPDNLSIEVKKDSNSYIEEYSYSPVIISSSSITNSVVIKLVDKNTNKTIDIANVEVINDGKDGASGLTPYHVELSNDFETISTLNGNTLGSQNVSTDVYLYEGNAERNVTSLTVNKNSTLEFTPSTSITNGVGKVTFDFSGVTGFNSTITPVITVNGKYKTFITIKPIEESILYYLTSSEGFVTRGENTDIEIEVKAKSSEGIISIDSLPSDMCINVYKNNAEFTSVTSTTLPYKYSFSSGDTTTNKIKFELEKNGVIYDVVNVEVKNTVNAFGVLELSPANTIVYLDNNNKPMVSSITLDYSFVYEGQIVPIDKVTIHSDENYYDFSGVKVNSGGTITLNYKDNITNSSATKEEYKIYVTHNSKNYWNSFYVTYIKGEMNIMTPTDTLYFPEETGKTLSCKLDVDVLFNDKYVTNECILNANSGITFNQRNGMWYINIPSGYKGTDVTVDFTYNNITTSKKFYIKKGNNVYFYYINVYPQIITNSEQTIEVYVTKGSYDGEYVSPTSFDSENIKLYYNIDNGSDIIECVIDEHPFVHGNFAFYPNGCETQDPIYHNIKFIVKEGEKIFASEVVERFDIVNDFEIKTIPTTGLEIDPSDIFKDFNNNDYDIVLLKI